MSAEKNKALIKEYIEASWVDKGAAFLEKYVNDDVLKQHIMQAEAAMPGYKIEIEDIIAEGDKVFVRGTTRGTQTGEFNGIPASGKDVELSLYIVYQIADGKIVNHWMLADTLTFLQQVGAIPAPSQG